MRDFDVIVLGGGSAGTSAAAAAHAAGARTLMVNDGELGGLCILRGCMPTKALLASAHALHEARQVAPFGVRLEGRLVADFERIMERKEHQVRRFQRAKIASVGDQDYEVLFGRARFAPGGGVEIDGRRLNARSYVIATGSTPARPSLPGIDEVPVATSDEVLGLSRQPGSLLVQGAGAIGLELSQFFARIGTHVTLVNRSPLLSRWDAECGAELTRALDAETGLQLAVPGAIERLHRRGAGLRATIRCGDGPRKVDADLLLLATGRCAALTDLGLEHVGLTAENGGLDHDAQMRTARPNIYVAGDATGRFQVLHLANQEGAVAGSNAAGATPARTMSYRLKMSVIFSEPPFATVGLGEGEARERGIEPIVGRARFPETGRAITMNTEYGLWKLFVDGGTRKVLGSAVLGPRADDLVHLVATLMHFGGRVDDICDLPWYHPTLSEVMLKLGRDVGRQLEGCLPRLRAETAPPGYSSTMKPQGEVD